MLSQVTERAQTACCHASEVVFQSEAPEQSEDRGVVRGDGERMLWMTERAQTACCHASEVVYQSEAPEQSEDRGVVRGDGIITSRI